MPTGSRRTSARESERLPSRARTTRSLRMQRRRRRSIPSRSSRSRAHKPPRAHALPPPWCSAAGWTTPPVASPPFRTQWLLRYRPALSACRMLPQTGCLQAGSPANAERQRGGRVVQHEQRWAVSDSRSATRVHGTPEYRRLRWGGSARTAPREPMSSASRRSRPRFASGGRLSRYRFRVVGAAREQFLPVDDALLLSRKGSARCIAGPPKAGGLCITALCDASDAASGFTRRSDEARVAG
jgi:hypothetical protein